MAFEWDDIQTQFLQRRLGPLARKLETKYAVAGSQLEIDLVLERPAPDAFFDFLSEHPLVENKAPDVIFSRSHLYRSAARALLYAERESLPLKALEQITQVVLCSRASGEISRSLPWSPLRPGIRETPFVTRLVLVEANRLKIEERAWEVLVHYASGDQLRTVIETLVDREVHAL